METTTRLSVDPRHLAWEDLRFLVESFRPRDRLYRSLGRVGMLTCPWVWTLSRGRAIIVDGFKRLEWAVREGIGPVDCLAFPEDMDPARLMALRVEGKLLGPPLNVAEKARIVAGLRRCEAPRSIDGEVLAGLGIAARPDAVEAWCGLAAGGDNLLRAAASEEISERTALELARWDGDARARALQVLLELRCSASIQAEILERVTEISRRDGEDRARVLDDPRILVILDAQGSNHREKTHALRRFLTRLRFPRLSSREERFSAEMEKACLPASLRLVPPQSFEGDRWQAVLSFSGPRELEDLAGKAMELARSTRIRAIMRPGPPNPR